ncbi:spore germination protein [Oceanobacillus salinisoli]|uniref:spore germination protein n=1 Tax=Oceanobacillus salinisoli TaxID=2678611 RepID=UPI001E609C33|nr:spore germination protein [Oceanobacillus salinisoli]
MKKRRRNPELSSLILDKNRNVKTENGLKKTVGKLEEIFKSDSDFTVRNLTIYGEIPAVIIYLNSMVDKDVINQDIAKPLMNLSTHQNKSENEDIDNRTIEKDEESFKRSILNKALYYTEVEKEESLANIIEGILRGKTAVIVDGIKEAFLLETAKIDKRGITEPEKEQVIRGPREGLIESLPSNIALLRKRLPVPELRLQSFQIGELTKSKIVLSYIEGITNKKLIKEVERRLNQIQVDRILDSGYVEQFIEDNPRSPFPQVQNTERPEVVAGNLLEGRVAILVDGSPAALIVPATFNQFYQTPEDYNMRFIMATLIRWVRLLALLFSVLMPSLYVALISFHPELIPTAFAVAVTSGRSSVPFPTVVEVLFMEAAMEILREATIRMPKQIGSALSIVGVLVIGEAAVAAGFVSPITVVVIALTSICSFATPAYDMAIGFRMVRFPLLLLTGILGFYGFVLGVLLINNHLISLKSFGVPYMTPVTPMNFGELKDSILRAPLNAMKDRPESLLPIKKKRIKTKQLEKNNPLQQAKRKQQEGE